VLESIANELITPVTSTATLTEFVISKVVTSESQIILTFSQLVSLIAFILTETLKVQS